MLRRPPYNKLTAKSFAAISVLALSIAVSGCGNNSEPDLANGKTQFIAKCGSCHTLARANSAGTIGPNLDDAFRQARRDGMGNTIEGVVLEQIKWPSQKLSPSSLVMPKDLVTGLDAQDVAAYVSYAAANPGKDTGALEAAGGGTDGKGMFKSNCGSCHVLADAGTSGTVGPDLDARKPNLARVKMQIENGGNGMPAFKGTLTDEQIEMIAKYVASVDGS